MRIAVPENNCIEQIYFLFLVQFPGGPDGKESACSVGDLSSKSLGWEDPLEEEIATHSSILA